MRRREISVFSASHVRADHRFGKSSQAQKRLGGGRGGGIATKCRDETGTLREPEFLRSAQGEKRVKSLA